MSKAEFKAWVNVNPHLKHYTACEVAQLALHCGFKMNDIAPDLTDWINVSMAKLRLWESPLFEQWVSLWACQNGHDWDA